LTPAEQGRIADAIYKAEGGPNARVPYGILSMKVKGKAHARQVCLTSIRLNYERWQASGYTNFVNFMADRWCPRSADPVGNRNWKKNVSHFLGNDFVRNRLTKAQ
jgi:hypothetical protein